MSAYQGILTDRQTEVICLLMGGLTNRQIGERLYLAPSTVRLHLENAARRLNVLADGSQRTAVRIVVEALRRQLVRLDGTAALPPAAHLAALQEGMHGT